MQSCVNDGLRAFDTLLEQLKERKNTILKQTNKFPEEVMDAIDSHIQEDLLTKPEGAPFWTEGPRLIERLSALFQSIDSVNKAPTRAQQSYFSELKQEFEAAMIQINAYLGERAKLINRIFSENNVPTLLIPSTIEY